MLFYYRDTNEGKYGSGEGREERPLFDPGSELRKAGSWRSSKNSPSSGGHGFRAKGLRVVVLNHHIVRSKMSGHQGIDMRESPFCRAGRAKGTLSLQSRFGNWMQVAEAPKLTRYTGNARRCPVFKDPSHRKSESLVDLRRAWKKRMCAGSSLVTPFPVNPFLTHVYRHTDQKSDE